VVGLVGFVSSLGWAVLGVHSALQLFHVIK
jgi:hypothetical protein